MKHNNKKWRDEKKFIALKTLYWEKCDAINNLGWVELDRPYQDGWYAFLSLRKDVSNREDAWVFQYIADNHSTEQWARNVSDFWWNRRKQKRQYWSHPKPHVSGISKHTYESLPPQVKKWFAPDEYRASPWSRPAYRCVVPDFFFEISYRRRMITKVRVFDSVLESEKSFLADKLYSDFPMWRYGSGAAPKSFRKMLNRSERARSKQALHKTLRSEEMEFDFRENHRGAAWLYW